MIRIMNWFAVVGDISFYQQPWHCSSAAVSDDDTDEDTDNEY